MSWHEGSGRIGSVADENAFMNGYTAETPQGRSLGKALTGQGIADHCKPGRYPSSSRRGFAETQVFRANEPAPEPDSKIPVEAQKESSLKSQIQRKVISEVTDASVDHGLDEVKEYLPEPKDEFAQTANGLLQENEEAHRQIVERPITSWATGELGLPSGLVSPLAEGVEHVPLPQDNLVGKTVKTLRWISAMVDFVATGGLSVACLDLVRPHLQQLVREIASEVLTPENPGIAHCREHAVLPDKEAARRRTREADEQARLMRSRLRFDG